MDEDAGASMSRKDEDADASMCKSLGMREMLRVFTNGMNSLQVMNDKNYSQMPGFNLALVFRHTYRGACRHKL